MAPLPREDSKLITCVLPDEAAARLLVETLYGERQITRIEVVPCLASGNLTRDRKRAGTSPDATMAQLIKIVVPAAEADAVFEYIYEKARIGRPGGGVIFQYNLANSTPYVLPNGAVQAHC